MHLGAVEINVEHKAGWGFEFASQLNIGITNSNVSAGVNVDGHQHNGKSLLYKATLGGTEMPNLPDKLVWYNFENTWQKIAEGRLKFQLMDFDLNLQYNDNYGINSELKSKISKGGFDLGGKFENHVATTWHISGTFRNR